MCLRTRLSGLTQGEMAALIPLLEDAVKQVTSEEIVPVTGLLASKIVHIEMHSTLHYVMQRPETIKRTAETVYAVLDKFVEPEVGLIVQVENCIYPRPSTAIH